MKSNKVVKAAKYLLSLPVRYWKNIIFAICWYAGIALALNAFIQYRIGMPAFLSDHPRLWVAGSLVLLLIMVIAHGVCGNPFLGTAVVSACLVLLSYADKIKYALRMEHVYPGDLEMFFSLDQLEGMYDSGEARPQWFLAFAIVAAGILVTILLARARAKRIKAGSEKRLGLRYLRFRIIARLFLAALGLSLLLAVTWPVRSPYGGDIWDIDYDYIAWNQTMNYERNGFVAAFISNLKEVGMAEPAGYSEQRVREIAEKYGAVAEIRNKGRTDLASGDIDVIYIMNESFSDPDRFAEYYPFSGPADELVPNLHRIMETSSSGWMYSPRYGGGTANIEFEVLTGMSTYFTGWAYPYQSMLPAFDSFPSVENVLEQPSNVSVGLHAYGGSMYRRNVVYPVMGYDVFAGSEDFRFRGRDRTSYYISDESAYNETKAWLNGEKDVQGNNYFITLVTMQNHPQYGKQYDEHSFTSLAADDYTARQKVADYMELIHDTDAALGEFIDWVAARDKKTAVVFWGDHLPGVYDRLFEIDPALGYETPFFIYTNFEEDTAVSSGGMMPESVSPNYITTLFLDRMLAKKPAWYYLLDDVKKDFPILTAAYWQESPPEETQAFEDYHMIEYDMLKGKQYALEYGMFE